MAIDTRLNLQIPQEFLCFLLPSRLKIAYGGRGSAKSQSFASLLVQRCYAERTKVLCVREFMISLKDSSKALIEEMIRFYNLEWFFKTTESGIVGLNGSEFLFKGLHHNIGSLNSIAGIDICFLEEAQFNERESLEQLFPSIRKTGSEIWIALNPRYADDPIYKDYIIPFLAGEESRDVIIINVNYYNKQDSGRS